MRIAGRSVVIHNRLEADEDFSKSVGAYDLCFLFCFGRVICGMFHLFNGLVAMRSRRGWGTSRLVSRLIPFVLFCL